MRERGKERGGSLIGLLIAILIIGICFLLYNNMKKPAAEPTRPGGPTTYYGQSLEKGNEVDCMNNLKQIRLAITMARTQSGETEPPPATLPSLRSQGIGPQMLKCPVSQQPYQYNSQTGQVWCPTPGHEKY